ncbi:MAG TPA: hypothetical protein VF691_17510 [Cytophagaceae bacterium]|jgi:hypothetical protein
MRYLYRVKASNKPVNGIVSQTKGVPGDGESEACLPVGREAKGENGN